MPHSTGAEYPSGGQTCVLRLSMEVALLTELHQRHKNLFKHYIKLWGGLLFMKKKEIHRVESFSPPQG